ncbi:Phosphoribosylanthranilate isomerase [Rubrobacter radiotolerans]|uniref:N-(5'-phosphoribosyl)anthranilate isomerase n=1 Tax=Rubrobacter radiotolerans TaxID=42256 RepID=A0A023X4N2_RUBRA|nr:phosphoribosylanthranilate isomerase [Rubrobacter radiotolerans]AHY47156.1 Phosphoribosylanthranilate isomerase [Rubrobacter radiotolerans]MDX5894562.1 phosphoribosylanthranilate isomerase [Rubrobacter radiotolerans]SMC06263.1 phosphoribosylanthranilate isomerase [Rubrobacter radiotolerans DSM 5868]
MVFVKVCGITSVSDARLAARAGADAIGLVFAESPRRVTLRRAREIAEYLIPDNVRLVGVFVNEAPDVVVNIAREVGLDLVQLHGDESPETVAYLKGRGLRVMKALRVRDEGSIARLDDYGADLFLLDAFSERARGGTGEPFDWSAAKGLSGRANIVVSGGLSAENVAEAIEFFRPYGVDASSGLEESPGVKDGEKVRRFVSAARGE